MPSSIEWLISRLRADLQALGHQGGSLTPSIYDTAQLLRYHPPGDPRPALDWLLRQQHADGGWGPEVFPLARHVPTLAAVLALRGNSDTRESRAAVERGLEFLRRTAEAWAIDGPLPDDIPVAAELILPQLLDEATAVGIELPHKPFQTVRALGEKRRALIARMKPRAGTAPVHAWEAWGTQPAPEVLDEARSVGHSPAATALWLRLREAAGPSAAGELGDVEQYLCSAAASTGTGVPGVVPTVWPIDRFEQSWPLHALSTLGLLKHPSLQDAVQSQLDGLHRALRPEGIGMSDAFIFDGDITSTVVALLADSGREVDPRTLERFQREGLFITYAHELQPSLTTTAHGLLALATLGRDVSQPVRFLLEKRGSNGMWAGDKWHCSWLYTTSQVMVALARAGAEQPLCTAAEALLSVQHAEGGWGVARATPSETAYAIHGLYALRHTPGPLGQAVRRALLRAARWLEARERAPGDTETYWIGKELYCPHRVDSGFVLSARLALELDREALST